MPSYRFLSFAVLALASACAAPAYRPPPVNIAPAYDAAARTGGARIASDTGVYVHPASSASTFGRSALFNNSASSAPFWRALGDSTLEVLINDALRTSTDVQVAQSRLTSARAARRLSAFDLVPTVTAIGSATRSRLAMAQMPGLSFQPPSSSLYDVGFDASWELDVFGRVRRNVSAQSAFVESAEHGLDDVQVSLAAEVARTYFELRGAQRQLEVAQRNADVQRKTVALTQDRLAAGRGTGFDTERARSVLQLTLAAVPAIETQIAANRFRLAVLLGRPAEELPSALAIVADLPALPDTVSVGSPRELVRRRPDVLSAERLYAAHSLSVGVAQSAYLPRLTIGASAGYASTRFDSLTRSGSSRILVGPVLSWPLLDLGRVRQRVEISQAGEEEARVEYTATVLRAVEETQTALVAYDRSHARVAILSEAVRASTRAAELAQQRFEAGLTDFLQVLDAQRTLLEAENQLAQAHTAAVTALVSVYKATGGTWPLK
jgi:outer membrane protein, multidrug efflux system